MPFKLSAIPMVYLDLNHLINLAQAMKSGNTALFDRLVHLSESHKACFVASMATIWEVLEIKSPVQKQDIVRVVHALTDRTVVRDRSTLLHMEMTNAYIDYFSLDRPKFPLPLLAFAKGYLESFGCVQLEPPEAAANEPELYAQVEKTCLDFMMTREVLDKLMQEMPPQLKNKEDSPLFLQFKSYVEQDRESWKDSSFHVKERMNHLVQGARMTGTLREMAEEINIVVDCDSKTFDTQKFLGLMPTFVTESTLILHLYHKDLTAKVEVNDIADILHLSVAMPYCDVVVCDNRMWDTIKKSNLDDTFTTKVFRRLAEAVDYLEEC